MAFDRPTVIATSLLFLHPSADEVVIATVHDFVATMRRPRSSTGLPNAMKQPFSSPIGRSKKRRLSQSKKACLGAYIWRRAEPSWGRQVSGLYQQPGQQPPTALL